jgi:HlyD family secretion protein
METDNNIELRSEEVQEILTRPPRWILRWGITLIFVVLIGLLVGSWLFKYPEILTAPIVVSTENLPFDVVAKTSGRIDTLYVAEKQNVTKNQILGILENTANTEDVLWLEKMLADESPLNYSLAVVSNSPLGDFSEVQTLSVARPYSPLEGGKGGLMLGELQSSYGAFQKYYEDNHFFIKTDYHSKKMKTIERQKTIQQNLLNQS